MTGRTIAPLALVVITAGCASYTRTTRMQQPFFRAPQNTQIALVSVTVPEWVMERAPSDFSNMPGMVKSALTEAFQGSHYRVVDRTDLGFTMAIGPRAPNERKVWIFTAKERPSLPADQVYIAEAPTGLPTGVTEPLVLGVYVAGWTLNKKQVGTEENPRHEEVAEVDLVYALWQRGGQEEIETRRVRVTLGPGGSLRGAVSFIPKRSHWMTWDASKEHWSRSAPRDRAGLFRFAVRQNTAAFAFPFGRHEIHMTAVWDDSAEAVKPGIEQAKAGRLAQAYKSWEALRRTNPKLAPAVYNMAVVREIEGSDDEAITLYREALKLQPRNATYQRALKAIEERSGLRKSVVLEARR